MSAWTAIGKLMHVFGKAINRDLLDSVSDLKSELNDLKTRTEGISKAVDQNEIDRIRYEILTFASDLQRGFRLQSSAHYHQVRVPMCQLHHFQMMKLSYPVIHLIHKAELPGTESAKMSG